MPPHTHIKKKKKKNKTQKKKKRKKKAKQQQHLLYRNDTYPLRHDLKDSEYSNFKKKQKYPLQFIEHMILSIDNILLTKGIYLECQDNRRSKDCRPTQWPTPAFLLQFPSHFPSRISSFRIFSQSSSHDQRFRSYRMTLHGRQYASPLYPRQSRHIKNFKNSTYWGVVTY